MSGLPRGWVESRLDEIAAINPGRLAGTSPSTLVSFVPMQAVSDILGEIVSPSVRPISDMSGGYTQFQNGDVIFAKITPCMENGKIAVAKAMEGGIAFGSTEFHIVRPLGHISADYIWRFLRQSSFRRAAEGSMTGAVGQRRVPASYIRESRLPLPPLPEQRRIVAKIDSLTAKSRRARDHLDHIPRLVEKYKQAVLDSMFTSLTDHVPLCDLVDAVRGIPYGIVQTGDRYVGGIPTVRCGDIKSFNVTRSELKLVDPVIEENYKRTRLIGGEVLIAIRGSVGETCVAGSELAGCNISREVAMIPLRQQMSPQFVMYYLTSAVAKEYILSNVRGVAQQGINLRDLKILPTPVCGFEEQKNLVERIERAFTWIDRLAAEATSARALVDRIDQAVLGKAFRGELVPQDPADEPASVLLDRIRAERAAAPKPKRGRRPRAAG